jgi:hypothetical protein
MDMRFGTWNVRSMYRTGSLMTVEKKVSKYKLDLAGVQEVRWDGVGTEPAGECPFFYGKENRIMNSVQGCEIKIFNICNCKVS